MISKTKSTVTIYNIVKIKAEEEKQRISLEEYTDYSKKLNRELVRPVSFMTDCNLQYFSTGRKDSTHF